MFSIPYKTNFLLNTCLRYLIVFLSSFSSFLFFHNLKYLERVLIFSSIITLFYILLVKIEKLNKFIDGFHMALAIFSSIAWLKFFSGCLLDVIQYISLLFKINKTFLSIVIISGGNSLGDLFANAALS